MTGGPPVHPEAATGFGRSSELYERARPGYPSDAVARLIRELAIGPGSIVVDLAAGTGKLTRLLTPTGADVVAIEPLEAMRAVMATTTPEVRLLDGTAEQIPLEDASVDAVTVAQAFHWFDAFRATTEIARILRPGGGVGLVWNVRDGSIPWIRELSAIMESYRRDTPAHRSGAWRRPFEATELFEPLRERSFHHDVHLAPDQVVDRVLSVSFIAALPEPDRATVSIAVRDLLDRDPQTSGRRTVTMAYRTDVFWSRRR